MRLDNRTALRRPEHTLKRDVLPARASVAYVVQRRQFVAVVIAQLLMLTCFAVPKAYTLATGRIVTLRTVPVDPCDLFRGEYANLHYKEISQVDSKHPLESGQEIYVVLHQSKRTGNWELKGLSSTIPVKNGADVILKGKVVSVPWDGSNDKHYTIEYGVERLYTPRGKSAELEKRAKELFVDLAIDGLGTSVIKQVRLDGRTIYDGTAMLNPFRD